ncbi:RrF2 family transcriptional regulator [[Ruminococcus] lactaris]|uniref:Rrf2 family transcriptional regulator n=1 Tax=[Ruminococcus] lactaris TaxID=46228 RepID=A0A415D1T2_9FIRM|nr:Rrf2 family transcriptional regulator [[Ruminococcus] lactaris]RHJ60023.1 Rrf2 family transcriptional regulator [[Ruminococcus] lactaris]
MQLNITTDYAIRIVYYLALKEETITASELASVLKIPVNYISKITKKLKAAEIVQACEGIKGGYALMKKPGMISLFDIVSSMEVTMKINRCLEPDGFCSRNATDYCNVHKALLNVQKTYEDALKSVTIADLI